MTKSNKKMNHKFLKGIWFSINLIILIYAIYLYQINKDGAIVFIYLMYLVSFPLGLAVPFVFVCMDKCVGYDINMHYGSFPIVIDIFIPWVLFLIAGYLQWFIVLPKILKYFRSKSKNRRDNEATV